MSEAGSASRRDDPTNSDRYQTNSDQDRTVDVEDLDTVQDHDAKSTKEKLEEVRKKQSAI